MVVVKRDSKINWQIKIVGYTIKQGDVLYQIQVFTTKVGPWTIHRRLKDFQEMHEKIQLKFLYHPDMPKKMLRYNWFGNLRESVIEDKRQRLQRMLAVIIFIVRDPRDDPSLSRFLEAYRVDL
eukprot:Platyproteum_vivax@DN2971_c0_g1_i1.p1